MSRIGTSSQRLDQGVLLNARYSILEVVGRGGMGTVYKALDTRLDVPVAVKEMTERDVTPDERATAIRQFEREAKMLGQLQHINLPRVTDYFVEEDHWYLIMEFVVGDTLENKLREANGAALPLGNVLDWAVQIADVLAYLHGQKPPIVFRDVKPANVMVQEDGTAKLIDFGIARRFTAGATKDTLLYGSPGYSPPEQYGRAQTDPRSDIYALGATLHHLVTGRDPAPTPFKFPSIRSIDGLLPPALDVFVTQCVEMDEAKRVQTAEIARDTLVHIRTASLLSVRPSSGQGTPSSRSSSGQPGQGSARNAPAPRVLSSRVQRAQDLALVRKITIGVVGLAVVAGIGAAAFKSLSKSPGTGPVRPIDPIIATPVTTDTSPPPTQLPTTGSIRLTSTPPGALVVLDGKEVGHAPLDLTDIAPGKHTICLTPPEDSGLVSATRVLDIVAGENPEVTTALARGPGTGASVTSGVINSVSPQPVTGSSQDRNGVRFNVDFRITGALSKQGLIGVFLYSAEGAALQPAGSATDYANQDGQLATFAEFKAVTDPADFPDMNLFIPQSVFPVAYDKASFRVIVFLDNKIVGQSGMLPLITRNP